MCPICIQSYHKAIHPGMHCGRIVCRWCAAESYKKSQQAQEKGWFDNEIHDVSFKVRRADVTVGEDEEPGKAKFDKVPQLRSAFEKDGTITAANASKINDGAAALLIASSQAVQEYGLKPLVRIVSSAVAGVEPRIMGIGPVMASRKALKRAGLTLDDMDVLELNEAFSAQVLACTRELGLKDNDPRINPNGGAISLGHPLGMSGSRILLTAARQLQATNKRYALVTMCIGVGQGYATILEKA